MEKKPSKSNDTVSTFLELLQEQEQESGTQNQYAQSNLPAFNLEETVVLMLRLLADGQAKPLAAMFEEANLASPVFAETIKVMIGENMIHVEQDDPVSVVLSPELRDRF